jgi:hypothetical protein
MIIQTFKADFLIEEDGTNSGGVFIYSDNLEEMQRLFGSSEYEYSSRSDWKYRVSICKQDLVNTFILMVKEVNYQDFTETRIKEVWAEFPPIKELR